MADKLRIIGTGLDPCAYKILVNETILEGVKSLTLYMSADSMNELNLTLSIDHIEVDGEFITALEGHIKKEEESNAQGNAQVIPGPPYQQGGYIKPPVF